MFTIEGRCTLDRLELHYRVEVPAERHVVCDVTNSRNLDRCVEFGNETRDVLDRDRTRSGASNVHCCDDQSGGRIEPDDRLRFGHLDHACLHQHCGDTDGAVSAHRQAA